MNEVTKVTFQWLSDEERRVFMEATQERVIAKLKQSIDPELVDRFIEVVRQAEKDVKVNFDKFLEMTH